MRATESLDGITTGVMGAPLEGVRPSSGGQDIEVVHAIDPHGGCTGGEEGR
jgi:hypothetical protein